MAFEFSDDIYQAKDGDAEMLGTSDTWSMQRLNRKGLSETAVMLCKLNKSL